MRHCCGAKLTATTLGVAFAFAATALAAMPAPNARPPSGRDCRDTTIATVGTRLQGAHGESVPGSGFVVEFSGTNSHSAQGGVSERIVTYEDDPANRDIRASRPGDRVRVCLASVPAKDERCDPRTDPRGRTFRVYDLRNRRSYVAANSEHGCGGA